jgi:hypothetical protein
MLFSEDYTKVSILEVQNKFGVCFLTKICLKFENKLILGFRYGVQIPSPCTRCPELQPTHYLPSLSLYSCCFSHSEESSSLSICREQHLTRLPSCSSTPHIISSSPKKALSFSPPALCAPHLLKGASLVKGAACSVAPALLLLI